MANGAAARSFSPNDSIGSAAALSSTILSPGTLNASRFSFGYNHIPRESPEPGGGRLSVHDRSLYEDGVRDVITLWEDIDEAPAGLGGTRARGSTTKLNAATRTLSGINEAKAHRKPTSRPTSKAAPGEMPESPRSSNLGGARHNELAQPRPSQEERKRSEIVAKNEKLQAVRDRDRKKVQERIEREKDMREVRFKRLLENISGQDNLAYRTAMDLRDRDERERMRRQEQHDQWSEKVHQPIQQQAYDYLNPPDRAAHQQAAGKKHVSWSIPGRQFRLSTNVHDDPNRRPQVDHHREHSFHQTAGMMLGHSQSAPTFQSHGATIAGFIPKSLSRPVLEPTEWGQVQLQGTLFGLSAQLAEHGAGFRRTRRGGSDAHLHDPSDNVYPAGTRYSRADGHGDFGILRGDKAASGESAALRTYHGASSGAPAQDHFTYETGHRVTDVEFPLGKRSIPQGI